MRLSSFPTRLVLVLPGFACETSPGSPPAPNPDASAVTSSSTTPGSQHGCPIIPPDQSAPCTVAGLRCEWSDDIVGTTDSYCDGHLWRVAARDRECASTTPSGTCGSFNRQCSYL